MQKKYITKDFLLQTKAAQVLYHDYAKDMPIIDYHCHLPVKQVADDINFKNIAQVWLEEDHYKWRAMRSNGINEKFCTGNASDREKFEKWAETIQKAIRNPLYHWTHLALNRPFGINDKLLGPETSQEIWEECNEKLKTKEFSARGIMKQMNVKLVCTTDDPLDSLAHHKKIAKDKSFDIKVLPTFRPDKAMAVEDTISFNKYLDQLAELTDIYIDSYTSLIRALRQRHDYFHNHGCRLSDHGLETACIEDFTEGEVASIFDEIRSGNDLNEQEVATFKSCMLYQFGVMNNEKNWTMQLHLGVIRNNNSRLFAKLGADAGFDSISDREIGRPLVRILNNLDRDNQLPKTIVYNLNPRDNELVMSTLGNFQDGSMAGKMQYGPGWWFSDQKDGIERQINTVSNLGLLSRFVGMVTDSRSFLSYTRHEYFRRILCNVLGTEIENGTIPTDYKLIGKMVQDISYENASKYFGFKI